jgi:L-iditol 2-dehydrogenase
VSFVQGALLEPLAVCLHAIRRSRPPTRELVDIASSAGEETAALVFGAGAIGLLLASALAATQHFTTIVIADIDPSRLEIASSLNLNLKTSLLPKSSPPPSQQPTTTDAATHALQTAQALSATLKSTYALSRGFARVYDCTGVPACIQAGIYASAPGGAVVQIGMGAPVQTLPVAAAALREVDIVGVFRYDGAAYPAAVELMAAETEAGKFGDVVGAKIVTHRVALGEGERAFALAGKGVDEDGRPVVKVIVEG